LLRAIFLSAVSGAKAGVTEYQRMKATPTSWLQTSWSVSELKKKKKKKDEEE
jgi:hypothetical protein